MRTRVPVQWRSCSASVSRGCVGRSRIDLKLGKVAAKLTRARRPAWASHVDWVREQIAAQPDATLLEFVAMVAPEQVWTTTDANVCQTRQALRLTRTKGARPCRATLRRCRSATRAVDRIASRLRPRPGRVPRRHQGQNQHGADPRPPRHGHVAGGEDARRHVEYNHVPRVGSARRASWRLPPPWCDRGPSLSRCYAVVRLSSASQISTPRRIMSTAMVPITRAEMRPTMST